MDSSNDKYRFEISRAQAKVNSHFFLPESNHGMLFKPKGYPWKNTGSSDSPRMLPLTSLFYSGGNLKKSMEYLPSYAIDFVLFSRSTHLFLRQLIYGKNRSQSIFLK